MMKLLATTLALLLAAPTMAASGTVTLGGEIGAAATAARARLRSAPFDSLAWLRADLTGEQVSEFDGKWGHLQSRPFKNYSGDISGRYVEVVSLAAQADANAYPALRALIEEVPKHQRDGGYFSAFGAIDWQQPIDFGNKGLGVRMMPALWGNARLLCGLVEAHRAFGGDALLTAAQRLGDFYVGLIPRFCDPARMAEYQGGDTYAAGYPICYFPAMEGLVKLHRLTNDPRYLTAAAQMAEFYKPFDRLPIDHAHGMLCNHVSLLMLFEQTKEQQYLERVEKRWDELVDGGYANPAGGILEKCHLRYDRDEGCAIADWLRLNLELGRVTGKARYYAMAERTLHNHYLVNQTPSGGFGHRHIVCDANGVAGFHERFEEATWCCDFHGALGFELLRNYVVQRTAAAITLPLPIDFEWTAGEAGVTSTTEPGREEGEAMRQKVRLSQAPPTRIRVRKPHWAQAVSALDANGRDLPVTRDGAMVTTASAVGEATFVYGGGVYAEDRRCHRLTDGPAPGTPFVLGYGPNILATAEATPAAVQWPTTLAALRAAGWAPLSTSRRLATRLLATRDATP